MIWVLIALGYIACGFVAAVLIARADYKEWVANPLAGFESYSREFYRARDHRSTEEDDTRRREKLRSQAVKSGLLWGLVWPAALATAIAMSGWTLLTETIGGIAVSPLERERQKELEYKKAQKIVDEYNAEQDKKWEEEFKA